MMLRPYVLRHSREDAEEESDPAIEPTAAEEAAVAAVVHQAEDAHVEENDEQQWDDGEPGGRAGAPDGGRPQERERHQRPDDLPQARDVVRPGVAADHDAPLAAEILARHHDRDLPPTLDSVLLLAHAGFGPRGDAAVCCRP